jgi:hypothetical protein
MRNLSGYLSVLLLVEVAALSGCQSQETIDQRSRLQAATDDSDELPSQQPVTDTVTTTTDEVVVENTETESDTVIPPDEYFAALAEDLAEALQATPANREEIPRILYVNFEGADLKWGYRRGKSFILCKKEATLPAAELTDDEKTQIVAEVQRYFEIIKTKLIVTAEKPADGAYTIIYVGGTYADLGCKQNTNLLGIAPLDISDLNHNDSGFAFTGHLTGTSAQKVYTISTTIAHEAGHTFGLQHVKDVRDIMTPYAQPTTDGFLKSQTIGLFKFTQDEPAILRKQLGELLP